MKLLGLGDNVMDAYLFRGELYPGGNAANVAVLAKRAGAEKSGYIGVLATDAAGEHFRTVLQAENVDISRLRRGVMWRVWRRCCVLLFFRPVNAVRNRLWSLHPLPQSAECRKLSSPWDCAAPAGSPTERSGMCLPHRWMRLMP